MTLERVKCSIIFNQNHGFFYHQKIFTLIYLCLAHKNKSFEISHKISLRPRSQQYYHQVMNVITKTAPDLL